MSAKNTALKPPRPRVKPARPIIGWREWVGLGDLGVTQVKAKIDTGARTSAIHAFKIRPFTDGGSPHVSFLLHPAQRRRLPEIECVAAVHDQRHIRSSNGHQEERYVIKTTAQVGDHFWPIELTLTDRDQLGFRMLLGREAVRKNFVIDPGRSFVGGSLTAAIRLPANPKEPKK
ncbi:hypothetical protein sometimes fused to ribosomal protein S6 glutaminyl transferase [Candidatus Phaeomarinobacter ectocarpi]|uniref:Retropepsin-like aspartic endopeptidase domain-containing protein n=1 Tax=Candidatus Phaeomarinibacter ectocarpi TaxID=1458461 RepID=X5MNG3_9HYPH|nr:RimK/LysX family protein [Candidatus Phaeomarinobacter ectocarpi]CDO61235.1 hypothetical protein sometimes fused to ribosomal protein S6 glutaminyl transferase [Candidatus Phaeomarinobacter ectocarpi]